jgi:hypothetical protein
MTKGERDTARQPPVFTSAAAQWSVAFYGRWLRTGLDSWFHSQTTAGRRAIAFRPLILDSERDPITQAVDAVTAIPGGLERLRDAGSEALATWTDESRHSGDVLGALLRLSLRLPVASHIPALRRLLCEGYLNGQPRKNMLAHLALESALNLVVLDEGAALLRDLRRPEYWQPSFAATWLEGMARADNIHWFAGLLELRGDLQKIDPSGQGLQPVLRRMSSRGGGAEYIFTELCKSPDILDDWFESALFHGERPPLKLVERRDRLNKGLPALELVVGKDTTLLYGGLDPNQQEIIRALQHIHARLQAGKPPPPVDPPKEAEMRSNVIEFKKRFKGARESFAGL